MSAFPTCAADIVGEFLEAAVHTILCIRGVYPRVIFRAARKFNAPVRMSIHKDLNTYIAEIVEGAYKSMKMGIVHKLELVIREAKKESIYTVEKYVFEVGAIAKLHLNPREKDKVYEELGNFLIRLMSVDLIRERNKHKDLSFSFQMFTSCHDKALEGHWLMVGPSNDKWESTDKKETTAGSKGGKRELGSRPRRDFPRLNPIHSMTNPFPLTLNLMTPPPSIPS